jgi:hypothetical protein
LKFILKSAKYFFCSQPLSPCCHWSGICKVSSQPCFYSQSFVIQTTLPAASV